MRKSGGLIENIWRHAVFSSEKKTDFPEIEKSAAQMFHDAKQKHDGLILIGKCSQKGLKSLKRYEKNLISINRNSTTYEVDEVLCDGRKIALTAVNYLISCEHQKIGYVGDCHNETRYIGYQEALVHHGIAPDIDDVYDITPNEKNGYQAIAYFSQLETPPSAFYCANDILAIGILKSSLCHLQRQHCRISVYHAHANNGFPAESGNGASGNSDSDRPHERRT